VRRERDEWRTGCVGKHAGGGNMRDTSSGKPAGLEERTSESWVTCSTDAWFGGCGVAHSTLSRLVHDPTLTELCLDMTGRAGSSRLDLHWLLAQKEEHVSELACSDRVTVCLSVCLNKATHHGLRRLSESLTSFQGTTREE